MAAPLPNRAPLARGETLLEAAVKRQRGFPKPLPRPYAEARYRLFTRLDPLADELARIPPLMKYAGAAVLALRLHPDFLGAAFEPDHLLALLPAATKVGARGWRARLAEVAPTAQVARGLEQGVAEALARLVFLAVDEAVFLEQVRAVLERPEGTLSQAARHDLQRIESLGFLTEEEQIPPFDPAWRRGRVELVLHPCPVSLETQRVHLLQRLAGEGIAPEAVRFRPYPGAPTFVSIPLGLSGMDRLRGYNPLRTARLLEMSPFPMLRSGPTLAAPQPPLRMASPVAPVRIALFDGGFDASLPLLAHHAVLSPDALSPLPPHPDCVAHGTAVAGAILHGELNPHAARDVLPSPPVSIVGYRVFPLSDPTDLDLYEAIDAIERTVPKLAVDGIKVINLSFGPRGPISDDNISRFTYALDRLAYQWDLLPVVAVGNDGAIEGFGRIQAPADSVNSLSVGAYSRYGLDDYAVPYSCRGPGREGAKGKPDLVAFGGCERTPFHLVSARSGLRVLDHGTSFAAPLVTRRCAELLGRCPDLSPLLLRALLVHHSRHPGAGFDYTLGHGFCPESVDALLGCPPKTVSILLNHSLPPKGAVRLPIPLPSGVAVRGKVEAAWTLAVLAPVNPLSSLEYTSAAVAATFYPDSRVHTFTPPTFLKPRPPARKLNTATDADIVAALLSAQWTQSDLPVSRSANVYRHEAKLSGADLKWDTVTRSSLTLQGSSLHEPFLLLQAAVRHGEKAPVRFAGVITLRLPGTEADIYEEVIRAYPTLQKISVHAENEVRVTI